MALFGLAAEKARPALRTKAAFIMTAHLALRVVIMRRSCRDLETLRGQIDNWRVRTAAGVLTIAAMTIKHHDWLVIAFVANRAAGAPARK